MDAPKKVTPSPSLTREVQQQLQELQRLRQFRERPSPDWAIQDAVRDTKKQESRRQRRLAKATAVIEAKMSVEVQSHSRIESLRGGKLTIATDSASTSFLADRELREGVEQELRATGVTKVIVRVGQTTLDAPQRTITPIEYATLSDDEVPHDPRLRAALERRVKA